MDQISGGNLFLISTTHATKGFIYFQSTSNYIDLNNNLTVAGNATFTGSSIGIGTGANAVADIRLNGTSTLDVYSVSEFTHVDYHQSGDWTEANNCYRGEPECLPVCHRQRFLAVGYSSVPAGTGNAVFSGNVGIRTTSPTAAAGLDVALGDIFVASTEGLDTRTASGTLNIGELNATTITIAGSNGTVRTLNSRQVPGQTRSTSAPEQQELTQLILEEQPLTQLLWAIHRQQALSPWRCHDDRDN